MFAIPRSSEVYFHCALRKLCPVLGWKFQPNGVFQLGTPRYSIFPTEGNREGVLSFFWSNINRTCKVINWYLLLHLQAYLVEQSVDVGWVFFKCFPWSRWLDGTDVRGDLKKKEISNEGKQVLFFFISFGLDTFFLSINVLAKKNIKVWIEHYLIRACIQTNNWCYTNFSYFLARTLTERRKYVQTERKQFSFLDAIS